MVSDSPAGWYPDPYGRHELRYFDGSAWGEHVGDSGRQSSDPIGPDTPVLAPRAPAQTSAVSAPEGAAMVATAGTPTIVVKHKSRWPWVLLAIFLVFGLGIAGCVAIVVVAVDEVADEFNEEQHRHAISQGQFDAVQIGTPRDTVISDLGKQPVDSSSFSSEIDDVRYDSSCIYYWELGETFGGWYQFCFDGTGALTAKNG